MKNRLLLSKVLKLMTVSVLILGMLSQAGCTGSRDIADKAFITAIGLDMPSAVEKEGFQKGEVNKIPPQFTVSVEIIKPAEIYRKLRSKETNLIRTVSAKSVDEALYQLEAVTSRQLSLAHLRVLVIGEELAKSNFKDTSSFFEDHPLVARRLRVMFVDGAKAVDVLKTKPQMERYVAEELIHMIETKEKMALARANSFSILLNDLRTTEGRAFAPRLRIAKDGNTLDRSGGAILEHWKLAGWLNATETQNTNWLLGDLIRPVVAGTGSGHYTYCVDKNRPKITPVIENRQLKGFNVDIKIGGTVIQEQGKYLDLTDPAVLGKLEKACSATITKEVQAALYKAQTEVGIDYLGFGTIVREKDSDLYNKLDWDRTFREVKVQVNVDSDINLISLSR